MKESFSPESNKRTDFVDTEPFHYDFQPTQPGEVSPPPAEASSQPEINIAKIGKALTKGLIYGATGPIAVSTLIAINQTPDQTSIHERKVSGIVDDPLHTGVASAQKEEVKNLISNVLTTIHSGGSEQAERYSKATKVLRGFAYRNTIENPEAIDMAIGLLREQILERATTGIFDVAMIELITDLQYAARATLPPKLDSQISTPTDEEQRQTIEALTHKARLAAYDGVRAFGERGAASIAHILVDKKDDGFTMKSGTRMAWSHVVDGNILANSEATDAKRTESAQFAQGIFKRILPHIGALDAEGKGEYANNLIGLTAQTGNKIAQGVLSNRIANGSATIHSLAPQWQWEVYGLSKTFGNAHYEVSKQTLELLGVNPQVYIDQWLQVGQENLKWLRTYSTLHQNLTAIRAVESAVKGGTGRLTNEYGIRFPGRYPTQALIEQLHTAYEKVPYGLILASVSDYNGAFNITTPQTNDEMTRVYADSMKLGVQMKIIEAASRREAGERLLSIRDAHGPGSYLIIRGHGSEDSVEMGNEFIDINFLGFGPYRSSLILEDGAPLVFQSCSTGARGGIAEEVSRTMTGTVIAPPIPISNGNIGLTRNTSGKISFSISYPTQRTTPTIYRGGEKSVQTPEPK